MEKREKESVIPSNRGLPRGRKRILCRPRRGSESLTIGEKRKGNVPPSEKKNKLNLSFHLRRGKGEKGERDEPIVG